MADPITLERFDREARTAAGLTHPNIVAVHDVGSDGGEPYLVMELVDGPNLATLLADAARARPGARRSPARSATRSPRRTRPEWCTATSSRPTSCSTRPAR